MAKHPPSWSFVLAAHTEQPEAFVHPESTALVETAARLLAKLSPETKI